MTQARRAHGAHGENLVAAWYAERGWTVVDRNWRCAEGELDVVAERNGTVAFCEVKARRNDGFGSPFEAVTATKQRRLRRLAARWIESRPSGQRPRDVRFDVAGVLAGVHIEVREGAF